MGPGLAAHHKGAAPHPGHAADIDEPFQSACLPSPTNLPGSNPMSFVLAIDQGTTSSRAIVFSIQIFRSPPRAAGVSAAFSGLGLGRA